VREQYKRSLTSHIVALATCSMKRCEIMSGWLGFWQPSPAPEEFVDRELRSKAVCFDGLGRVATRSSFGGQFYTDSAR